MTNTYKVRVKDVGNLGIFTQADHWEDYTITSDAELEQFAEALSRKGFRAGMTQKWIMPGAILWVKKI